MKRFKTVLERTFDGIGSPLSLHLRDLLKRDEWAKLADIRVKPSMYDSASSYAIDAQCVALFAKNASLPIDVDRRAAALKGWFECERQNALTNARFANYCSGYFPDLDWRLVEFLYKVKRRIARILGPLPKILGAGRFGPGSTFEASQFLGDRRKSLTMPDKLELQGATPGAQYYATQDPFGDRYTDPQKFGRPLNRVIVRGNVWTTAPKNAVVDRSICMEPGLNLYYQLAIEKVLRRRLLTCGIDLTNAEDKHRRILQAFSHEIATLDMSSASDLWASKVYEFLLPELWFETLNTFRSRYTLVKDRWVHQEKFSSMGNGFTFPLQTIVFYAICAELSHPAALVKVYGDDMIVEKQYANDILWALKFFGHKPNNEKSFIDGPFKESCGVDVFNNVDVRPAYLWSVKEDVDSPTSTISFINRINRSVGAEHFEDFVLELIRTIPFNGRLFGPPMEEPEGRWIETSDPSLWSSRSRGGIREIRGIKDVGNKLSVHHLDPVNVFDCMLIRRFGPNIGITKPVSLPTRKIAGWVTDIPYRGTSGWSTCWYVA